MMLPIGVVTGNLPFRLFESRVVNDPLRRQCRRRVNPELAHANESPGPTSSSSTSATCAAFYRAIFITIMTPERHLSFGKDCPRDLRPIQLPQPALSLPSRKLAVCTIATGVEPFRGMFPLAPVQLRSR
jgi:hypothetical protein